MGENAWTDDGVAFLRKLWAEGATAADIGLRLGGLSRSAVLGKVFRLRLDGENSVPTLHAVSRKQTTSKAVGPVRRRDRQPRKRITLPPANGAGPKTLLELTNETCRWPSRRRGKIVFCGVAEADLLRGLPYCPCHMRRAYSGSISFGKTERGDFTHDSKQRNLGTRA